MELFQKESGDQSSCPVLPTLIGNGSAASQALDFPRMGYLGSF